ncbi:MAG TPA: protein kinase, partial [Burkholderiaceae bacterium]|nr:protein kinase [Burkholderiaceae bacterium]
MVLSAAQMAAMSRLLDEALPLDAAGRRRWLEHLPPEHAALADVLHAALMQSGSETSGAGQFATLPKIGSAPEAGAVSTSDEIGPYRLLRQLGSGGMGAVWLAERSDGAYKRQVALKLPRLAWATGLAERMRRERDILATLEHPHIARLYDAGVDAQGRPYLALEYIEGEPIDRYVQRHRLPVRARLALFLQVAEAVAHAHGRLVVHRDLKPSNILVNGEGQVQLLDFGIAKLLEADAVGGMQLTELAGAAMTPDYASPEQLRGETITVGSDVYSLGAVLYELLTDHRPYEFKGKAAAAVAEAMVDTDVPVASRQAAEKNTRRTLRGDLDTILTKALKKDPAQRYATVESFASDIKRYLAGLPVLARPDSTAYRTRKFVARHRIGVAGSLITLFAIISTGAAIWQGRRADFEANRGIANYNDAIRRNPQDSYAYFIRGIAWTIKGDHDRAIADFDQAIRLNPLYAAAYNSRGIAKYRRGDRDGAIADYTTAIGLPHAPAEQVAKALYNRGFAKGERGDG